MKSDIDVKPLKQLIDSYRYGKQLRSEDIEVIYNPKSDSVSITNFYAFGEYLRIGDCLELTNTSCMETNMLYPDHHVVRAVGHEPRYFFQEKARHYFNLLSKEKITDELFLEDKKEISRVLKKYDPWIVDPSFKYIQKFSESKYSVDAIFNEGCALKNSNTLTITKLDEFIPISMTSNNQLVYISMSPKYNETFQITIQDIYSPVSDKVIPIQDKQLYNLINCEKTLRTIEILRSKKKKISVQPIKSREEIFCG